ncbi:MAG TPA: transporter substrate-binding domain-containing protein, partial [Ramlibacter sp.]|nr:transporter substrate-binding domain-containing protein [Ramlibacter sp.]
AKAGMTSLYTGDVDVGKRRTIRILTPYSKTHYFVDRGVPRGMVQEAAVQLQTALNKQFKTSTANQIHVAVIPTSRDQLLEALQQGRGDIIAAGVTMTPEREKIVDFTVATKGNVKEIVVTGPGAPDLASLDDLAGKEIAVRNGSIQFESLQKLNESFKQQGKAPVKIRTVPTSLEDEDILEMANAGLLPIVVVDDFYAEFWKQILPGIKPHPDIAVREEGSLAWAVRKNSPKLLAVLNPIVKANAEGTAFGNAQFRKYLKDTKVVKSATSPAEIKKFNDLVAIFRKHAGKYEVDYLLMMAQGYQESRLDQQAKSPVGAIGVMQVMPATGQDMKVGDIRQTDPNVEAGVKYMRFMMDQYFKDEPMDRLNKGLMAFASYNAGAGRIRSLRREAAKQGLDPNVWFNNVERVVAAKIGRETVTYVSNIYKYYVAYTLVAEEMDEKAKAKGETVKR